MDNVHIPKAEYEQLLKHIKQLEQEMGKDLALLRNQKAQLDALRPYLKHTPECLMVESHDYSPCTCGLTDALNGESK